MKDAVTLTVPASMEVTFTPGQDGSMQVTITSRAATVLTPAGEAVLERAGALRQVRAARVARRGRPPGSGSGHGNRNQVGGQAWHDTRARNAAIRAFADADPRFSRNDYRSPGKDGGEPGYYISAALRKAYEEAQAYEQEAQART